MLYKELILPPQGIVVTTLSQLDCLGAGDLPPLESRVIHKVLCSIFLESVILILCHRETLACRFNFLLADCLLEEFILFLAD